MTKAEKIVSNHSKLKKMAADRGDDEEEEDEEDGEKKGKKSCDKCGNKCTLKSQCSDEAKMIQHLQETRDQMNGIAKSLKQQSETQRLLIKANDHHEVKKTEEELQKLKEELAKTPKAASLDVKVDGEHVGHMELQMGGTYDLNLKSDELPKQKPESVKLVDDGAKITKEKVEDAEAMNSLAKDISGSLKQFAQTNLSVLAQVAAEQDDGEDDKKPAAAEEEKKDEDKKEDAAAPAVPVAPVVVAPPPPPGLLEQESLKFKRNEKSEDDEEEDKPWRPNFRKYPFLALAKNQHMWAAWGAARGFEYEEDDGDMTISEQ